MEIPFMEAGGRWRAPPAMMAAFTTDIHSLSRWGKPEVVRTVVDPCCAYQRRVCFAAAIDGSG